MITRNETLFTLGNRGFDQTNLRYYHCKKREEWSDLKRNYIQPSGTNWFGKQPGHFAPQNKYIENKSINIIKRTHITIITRVSSRQLD